MIQTQQKETGTPGGLLIRNCRVIDPRSGRDEIAAILIEDGRIRAIGEAKTLDALLKEERPAGDSSAEPFVRETIDGTGWVAAPGFVDIHVHFRDPGFTYKEDIITGADAAAAGGYTTVVCMANTKPPVDSVEVLTDLLEREKALKIHVKNAVNVTKGMRGETLTDFAALKAVGAVGVTDDGIPIMNEALLFEALKKAKENDLPISLHEEDALLIGSNGVNRGRASEAVGVAGAPACAEEVMIARDCLLNKEIGAKLDIQHVS